MSRIAIVGDSYTSGSGQGGKGPNGWPALLRARLIAHRHDVPVDVGAEGGSGYTTQGNSGGGMFADHVAKTVKSDDGLVVIFGSRNDKYATTRQFADASCRTIQGVQAIAPSARILVIGPPWTNPDPPAEIVRMNEVLRDQCLELGAQFIDPVRDSWFADHPELIGADGIHPTDAGHQYMTDKIWPVVAAEMGIAP